VDKSQIWYIYYSIVKQGVSTIIYFFIISCNAQILVSALLWGYKECYNNHHDACDKKYHNELLNLDTYLPHTGIKLSLSILYATI